MKKLERQLKATANLRRLTILKLLKEKKEMSVGMLAEELRISFKATSRHLRILFTAGIVDREQRSLEVFHRISQAPGDPISRIVSML